MLPSKNTLRTLVLLLLLASASWWLQGTLSRTPPAAPSPAVDAPDYVIEDFSATTYDPQGRRKYVLGADTLTHFPDTDRAELTRPRLVQFETSGAEIHTRAQRGELSDNGKRLRMFGDVVIRRAGGDAGVVTTEQLDILLQ